MSCSDSSMPGGQPSTMQPRAGPWLSPKLVTVNSVPMVLPDMCSPASGRRVFGMSAVILACVCDLAAVLCELCVREHEHASTAVFELQPCERHVRKRFGQRALRIPDLDDEHAARLQMIASLREDPPHDVQAVSPSVQPLLGLAVILIGELRHLD